jgi:hypothetical protein
MKAKCTDLLLDVWHLLVGGQRLCPQDRTALQLAARFGMTQEYKEARRHNMRPLEALDEWDLCGEGEREMFKD